jgi:chemotaxis family two-component system response regulator Rcp1
MESIGMVAGALDILLVEDSPSDVRLTREAFKDAKVQVNLHVVTDGAEAMDFSIETGEVCQRPCS